jgi:Gpi18-like mannosyltransferase
MQFFALFIFCFHDYTPNQIPSVLTPTPSTAISQKKVCEETDAYRKYLEGSTEYKSLIVIFVLFVFSPFMHMKFENGWIK